MFLSDNSSGGGGSYGGGSGGGGGGSYGCVGCGMRDVDLVH